MAKIKIDKRNYAYVYFSFTLLGRENNCFNDNISFHIVIQNGSYTVVPQSTNFYVPVKLKLQHPTGKPRAFVMCIVPGEGEFERCREGGEFEPDLSLVLASYTPVSFFRFLQGLTDLEDGILPLLVNNSFKRDFKRSLKVSLRHISL